MRIAILSTPFVAVPPPRYGGTELVVSTLVEGLIARGHDVTLYATGDSRTSARRRFTYREAIWPPDPYHELTHVSLAIADIIAHDAADLIHAHTAPALAFARYLDRPIVYTVHHVRDGALNDLYARLADPRVTMVCISEKQRQAMADITPARVVYHGLDPAAYTLGAGTGGYAAFIGRFAAEKGVHVALDVARAAGVGIRLGGRPHWKDDDYFRDEVERRLGRPGVEWLGELSHAPKNALFKDAVATLFPIDWEEPFGLVMLESMLCGTPVLAFPRGAAPEVVDEGVTGWLVSDAHEMAERLRGLASGRLHFDRAACRAQAARRFGADRMVEGYLGVYEDALAGRGSGPTIEAWHGL